MSEPATPTAESQKTPQRVRREIAFCAQYVGPGRLRSFVMRALERDTWTDDRLDDLSRRTEKGFDEVKQEFKAVRGEIKELGRHTDEGFKEVKGEVKELRQELHRLNSSLLVGSIGVIGTLLAIGIFG